MTSPALICAPRVAGLALRSVAAPSVLCRMRAPAYRLAGSARLICAERPASGCPPSAAVRPLRGPKEGSATGETLRRRLVSAWQTSFIGSARRQRRLPPHPLTERSRSSVIHLRRARNPCGTEFQTNFPAVSRASPPERYESPPSAASRFRPPRSVRLADAFALLRNASRRSRTAASKPWSLGS